MAKRKREAHLELPNGHRFQMYTDREDLVEEVKKVEGVLRVDFYPANELAVVHISRLYDQQEVWKEIAENLNLFVLLERKWGRVRQK